MTVDLHRRGPEGEAISNDYLGRMERATWIQLDSILASREKLNNPVRSSLPLAGSTTEEDTTSASGWSFFSRFLASQLLGGVIDLRFSRSGSEPTRSARVVDLAQNNDLGASTVLYEFPAAQDVDPAKDQNQGERDDRVVSDAAIRGLSGAVPDADRGYWSEVRDRLLSTLTLSLHELATVLGLSYGNVQALGKRRPQTKTTRPLLRLDSMVRAYLAADPNRRAMVTR